jgi:DNA-binding NarL/FixJ family response regulator
MTLADKTGMHAFSPSESYRNMEAMILRKAPYMMRNAAYVHEEMDMPAPTTKGSRISLDHLKLRVRAVKHLRREGLDWEDICDILKLSVNSVKNAAKNLERRKLYKRLPPSGPKTQITN